MGEGSPMKDNKKKMAAVMAVVNYIKSHQEYLETLQVQPLDSASQARDASAARPLTFNVWGLGGRQQQMQLRTMMQLKTFHGSKRI
jgi:hypothetical protein